MTRIEQGVARCMGYGSYNWYVKYKMKDGRVRVYKKHTNDSQWWDMYDDRKVTHRRVAVETARTGEFEDFFGGFYEVREKVSRYVQRDY